jgi:TolB-like protein
MDRTIRTDNGKVGPSQELGEPTPTHAEVRSELQRILASELFKQASRSSEFLKFVVERTLAGDRDRLKGYTIAIDVFNRPDDFDALSDPLVRVQAGRLRRRLLEYYVTEGDANPVRISLPRGAYAPEFRYARREAVADISVKERLPCLRWLLSRRVCTALLAGAVAALTTVVIEAGRPPTLAGRDGGIRSAVPLGASVLVLPFENLTDDERLDNFSRDLREELVLKLNGAVVPARGSRADPEPVDRRAAGYSVLTGGIQRSGDRLRIRARLVHAASGTGLWSRAYSEDLGNETPVSERRVVHDVAETIARDLAADLSAAARPNDDT